MNFELTSADRDIVSSINISIGLSTPKCQVSGISGDFRIPFQFPPIITSDGKSMSWKTKNVQLYEPMINYDGASARKIQLKWKYIITGNEWNPYRIKGILTHLRAYYYRALDAKGGFNLEETFAALPLITIYRLYNIITSESTWRSSSISITPSNKLVSFNEIYTPLSYEVGIDLELVTQLQFDDKTKQKIENAKKFPQEDWA